MTDTLLSKIGKPRVDMVFYIGGRNTRILLKS
jgi:hypothetical protein